ncbi:MAG TPA: LysR family transcriptional regulator, partial [Duganella sp.]|nr:LysR family transcriptional regulator [Duganella sp.]
MDRLYTMSIFLAVVDEGGFAPAARKLRISPPVVTRAVTELEETMGVRLLTRTTRVVRVTDV